MRIAALYDIHSNLPAIEAVLEDVTTEGVDLIVIGGDVLPGPMPRETLDLLTRLEIPTLYIRGNGDQEILDQLAGIDRGRVPDMFKEIIRWTALQVTVEDEALISTWPATLTLDVAGIGRVLFCHATPTSDTDIFTRLTPDEVLSRHFAEVDADLLLCGHTHMQFDRTVASLRVVNAGSIGMPYQGRPGAYWLLVGSELEFRRTAYDYGAAAESVRRTGYPLAQDFADENILNPPSE